MIEIPLSKGVSALIDDDDFEKVRPYKWHCHVSRGGKLYAQCSSKRLHMHRVILGIDDRNVVVDHINGNGLDNRKSNLRACSKYENQTNRRLSSANKSGFIGVSVKKTKRGNKKYQSFITHKGKAVFLGYFDNPIDAARAYNKKALELFGDFANLNVINEQM